MKQAISLRLRITLFLATAIMLTLGAAIWVIDSRIDTEVSQRADANLLERAQALSDIFRVGRISDMTTFPSGQLPEFLADDGLVYFVIHCDGQDVASSAAAAALRWPVAADGKPHFADLSDPRGSELRAVVLPFVPESALTRHSILSDKHAAAHANGHAGSSCSLGLAVDRSEVEDFQGSMDTIFVGSLMLAMMVVVVLVPLLVSRGLRPLSQLAEAMRGIGPETPERRLAGANAHELKPLMTRFNEVLTRMEDGLVRERQFASGVAHELRTPLAELRTLVEVELRYPSDRDLRAMLADIGNIGIEMECMVNALLLLTRIEAGIEQVQTQSVDVAALTRKLLERHQRDINLRQLDMDARIEPGVRWHGDVTLLDVLLGNLLGNAVAYAPAGSRISLDCESQAWRLSNAASDLTAGDVALMSQRFWRKDKATGVHTGLGVALAAAAARAQGIRLNLSLHEGQLCARVEPRVHAPGDRPSSASSWA
ncbi:histidine kinase dimerization/phospho-acceptor domain-containing protein [Rhodanobacter sp. B04]|uniref:histidine kinase dimerization/phospho-acceptor domain-containing protein n=1 Tax=Rhodanobacter sp. B04 TaxID=1945860 RepID=UPI00143C0B2C|nr:histidine kinase dimerization/phospho-acceptor domain-containing protein [Rhodanobacter sp. B04]